MTTRKKLVIDRTTDQIVDNPDAPQFINAASDPSSPWFEAYFKNMTPDGAAAWVTNWSAGSISIIDTVTGTVSYTISVDPYPCDVAFSPDGGTAYVSSQGTDSLLVIAGSARSIIKRVRVGRQPTTVDIALNGAWVYVANAGSNDISIIDTTTHEVAATIRVGGSPFALAALQPVTRPGREVPAARRVEEGHR